MINENIVVDKESGVGYMDHIARNPDNIGRGMSKPIIIDDNNIDDVFDEFDDVFGEIDDSKMEVANIGFGKDEYKTSKPNILRNDAVVQEILNISEAVETAVGHTIGPFADHTLIQTYADREVPVFHTRDGFTILKNMKYTQPIPNAIFKILKSSSEYLDKEIGDSTSSPIPIQNALLKSFVKMFNNEQRSAWKISPIGIANIAKVCGARISNLLRSNPMYQYKFPELNENGKYTKEQEDEIVKWLTKVATISCNNDKVTGKTIAELYRNKLDGRGHVIATESKTEEEYYEDTEAYVLRAGLCDFDAMPNTADGFAWKAENPLVAMFDGPLEETDLEAFKQIVVTAAFDLKRPLFFTAGFVNFNIAQYIRSCIAGTMYNELGEEINDPNSNPDAKPVKISIAGVLVRNKEVLDQFLFKDTVLMTGAKPFSTELGQLKKFSDDRNVRVKQLEAVFGTCDRISSAWADTNFIGCNPNQEDLDAIVKEINQKIEIAKKISNHALEYSIDDLQARIDRLQARTTFYYCGGHSDMNKYSRKLIVEDAVKSVAAAIKNHGVSIGGNIAISHLINHNIDALAEDILENIKQSGFNVGIVENENSLNSVISLILQAIQYSFGHAYRYALYNMNRNTERTMEIWNECISNPEQPKIFNIVTNRFETFEVNNVEKCTDLIVPCNTDEYLMRFIIENVGQLITIGNMISLMSPNMDLEQLQLRQLETGAAYMAQNSILRS